HGRQCPCHQRVLRDRRRRQDLWHGRCAEIRGDGAVQLCRVELMTNTLLKTSMRAVLAGAMLPWLLVGCEQQPAVPAGGASAPPAAASLGIRPYGDEEVQIDMSQITSPELREVFDHIDANIDEHVRTFQQWIRQPSVSNTGEGIQESAELVRGYFDQLG